MKLRVRKISVQVPKKGNKLKAITQIIAAIASIISVVAVIFTYLTLKELQRQNDTTDSTLIEMQKQSNLTEATLTQMQIQSSEMQNQSELTNGTLKEMQLQRKKAYEPDLVINRYFPFKLYAKVEYSQIHTYFYNNFIDTSHIKLIDTVCLGFSVNPNYGSDYNIQLANIGLGAAKDVTLYWSYDTAYFINLYNNKLNHFENIKHIHIDRREAICIDNTPLVFVNETKEINYFKYVLADDSKDLTYIKIPKTYIKLWSLIKLCGIDINGDQSRILYQNPIPPLKLKISYFDINGNRYNKNYIVTLRNNDLEMVTFCSPRIVPNTKIDTVFRPTTAKFEEAMMEFNEKL